MIDIENRVIQIVKTALNTGYPNIPVYSDYTAVPSEFPCVYMVEDANTTYEKSFVDNEENHAKVSYTINVYTNDKNGRKSSAKEIANIIDATMLANKFVRSMMSKTPNIDDSIYRITMRYSAVVGKPVVSGSGEETTYRYQIYK